MRALWSLGCLSRPVGGDITWGSGSDGYSDLNVPFIWTTAFAATGFSAPNSPVPYREPVVFLPNWRPGVGASSQSA
jgi:hypothetical protein